MDKKIEFEGYVWPGDPVTQGTRINIRCRTMTPREVRRVLDDDKQRYRIILEPIEPELRPCPFCGSEDLRMETDDWNRHFVKCKCRAEGSHVSGHIEAVWVWNGGQG